jgi:ADP-ribose pyrophosphatase
LASELRVKRLAELRVVTDTASLSLMVDDLGRDPRLLASATRAALQALRSIGAALPDAPRPWLVRDTRRRFTSPWRNLDLDAVTTHSGVDIEYAYLTVDDAVWVVPLTRAGEIVLIRQYRHPVRDWCLEVPAGGVGSETPEQAAARELLEEVGGRAQSLRCITSYYPAPAHLASRGLVFLALGVELTEAALEETELLAPLRVPVEVAFDMARRGEISDSQSALALLACEPAVREELALLASSRRPNEQVLTRHGD